MRVDELKEIIANGENSYIEFRKELLRLFEANGALHFDISPLEDTSIKV
ncbi:MAG: hypothetical protein ABFD18_02780 [Syntrophomonas sp.]